ncbi:MAG: PAS domain S-box protein [Actinobacteria bacterium]|nr:PAS domain S-box protein [Actinomycetota bacterium]
MRLDYRAAFELAPIGLVLSRRRMIVDCNHELAAMFLRARDELIGQSLQILYPSAAQFERTGDRITLNLDRRGRYSDERIMRREPGNSNGELFWCHVIGRALDPVSPHDAGIWSFEDLSTLRPVLAESGVALTGRERDVAALLIEGHTSRQIGVVLGLSHRTVEVYRSSLLRKYGTTSTSELVDKLVNR